MFDNWDERFDMMCGAAIKSSGSYPVLDSGVHDLLYGEAEQLLNGENRAEAIRNRSGYLPNGNDAVTVH